MPRLIVLRHAATDWTPEHRLQGRRDLPLSQAGRLEAASWHIRPILDAWAEVPAAQVEWVASPLQRCTETVRLLGSDPRPEPVWMEQDYGAWEGRRLADLRARDPVGLAAIEAAGIDYRPPGGESPREVAARLAPWLVWRASRRQPTCVVVTHKGVLRALLALATGWTMQGPPPLALADGCAHVIDLDGSGSPSFTATNLLLVQDTAR